MHRFLLLIVTLIAVAAQADLVCLGWSLISPVVGLICHFRPEAFHAAENATVAAVHKAVESAKDLVEFDLTHNPASVTYNFLAQTNQGGLAQGSQYLKNITTDYQDVTIGFAKGSANQIVQIYDLTHWNDVSFCLIRGAGRLATQAKRRSRKRAGVPSGDNAVAMAQNCVSDKLKQLSKPAVFTITDPNQKVGSTISDIAALLVPVSVEAEVAADLTQGAFDLQGAVDLVIPGSEDTTRIVKKVSDNGGAQHFANEAEAQAVADNMRDQNWVDKNCGVCGLLISPQNIARHRLNSRGNILTSCCSVPATIPNPVIDLDTTFDEGESADVTPQEDQEDKTDQLDDPVYDPNSYNAVREADLVPAPEYTIRDVSIAADVQELQKDLDSLSTGVVIWSPELKAVTSSNEVFSTLRKVFTGPVTDPLYSSLQVAERDGTLRMQTFSNWWISKSDPALKPLQDFVNRAVQQGADIVGKLKGMDEAHIEDLGGSIEFFWTGPSQEALHGVDPRGFHVDGGLMQFVAADTPGLVVRGTVLGTASRVPVEKNAFQLIKATFWDMMAYIDGEPNGPTWHSVFGPEMAHNGRVSMVMSIFTKGSLANF